MSTNTPHDPMLRVTTTHTNQLAKPPESLELDEIEKESTGLALARQMTDLF